MHFGNGDKIIDFPGHQASGIPLPCDSGIDLPGSLSVVCPSARLAGVANSESVVEYQACLLWVTVHLCDSKINS